MHFHQLLVCFGLNPAIPVFLVTATGEFRAALKLRQRLDLNFVMSRAGLAMGMLRQNPLEPGNDGKGRHAMGADL